MAIGALTEQLQTQNDTLLRLNSNLNELSGSIATMVRTQAEDARRRREAEDDARRAASEPGVGSSGGTTGGAGGSVGGSGAGIFGGLGGAGAFGAGAATAGILKTVGGIAKRGILAGALNASAGVTADFIQEQTGSADLGDATFRAMKLGSFGMLFGKRIGMISSVVGALATDENIDQLKQMGENLGPLKDTAVAAFNKLPSMNEMLTKATSAFGDTLKMANSILEGDVSGMADASYGAAVVAAGAGNRRNRAAVKGLATAATGIGAPKLSAGEFSKSDRLKFNAQTVKGLSNRKIKALQRQGFSVDKSTGSVTKGNKFVSADDMDDAFKKAGIKTSTQSKGAKNAISQLNQKAASKFGRFGKLLSMGKRIPILGTLLTSGMIGATLMNDDLSKEEKTAELAKQFGGIGGATLGGILGGLAGTAVPGIGNLVGGLVGAVGGAVAGEKLAFEAAKMLLGEDSEIVEAAKRMGESGVTSAANGGGGASSAGGATTAPSPTTAATVGDAATTAQGLNSAPPVVIMDNSNNSTNVSGGGGGTSVFTGDLSPFDTYDPYNATRR